MNDMTHGLDSATLTLGIPGFTYPDLYEPQALARLTATFDAFLTERDASIGARLAAYRASQGKGMTPEERSFVLTDAAPHLGAFLARLFRIEAAWDAQASIIRDEDQTVLGFRNKFIEQLAQNNQRFLEACTPGYYNNEGMPEQRSARNGSYGAGAIAFIRVLEQWREAGDLAGLELTLAE